MNEIGVQFFELKYTTSSGGQKNWKRSDNIDHNNRDSINANLFSNKIQKESEHPDSIKNYKKNDNNNHKQHKKCNHHLLLLLNVASNQWTSSTIHKWCLYHVTLGENENVAFSVSHTTQQPHSASIRLLSWACEWDRIVREVQEVIFSGGVHGEIMESVHNITSKIVARLESLGKYNVSTMHLVLI